MTKRGDLLHLHFIVVILGFTAILGKLISLPAESIVFWRVLFALAGLLLYAGWQRQLPSVSLRKMGLFFGIGGVVAIHWLTFFGAIKLANVSVTLVCLSSSTLFTSLLEPLFFRRKISGLQFFLGLIIVFGVYLIFKFETAYALGISVALLSSLLASLFTVLNKKFAVGTPSTMVSIYELAGGLLTIVLYNIVVQNWKLFTTLPETRDLMWLFILGVLCTSYAYTASVKVMRSLSAYLIVLTVNMEPIYGILLGVMIFGESELMTRGFYLGAVVIFVAVFVYPMLARWQRSGKYRFLNGLRTE